MSIPSFTSINYQFNFEKSVITAFSLALTQLVSESNKPLGENALNRILYRLVKVSSKSELWDIFPECNNLPNLDSELKEPHEDKRPDFTCAYKDTLEEDPFKNTKTFIVECKRLGNTIVNGKKVNELYTSNGIKRFINKGHSYGAMSYVGGMVGYIQDMDHDKILLEINIVNQTHSVPELTLSALGWQLGDVTLLHHDFDRPEIDASPFKLHHLWVDLR